MHLLYFSLISLSSTQCRNVFGYWLAIVRMSVLCEGASLFSSIHFIVPIRKHVNICPYVSALGIEHSVNRGTGCEELRIGTRDLQKDRRPVYQVIRFSLIRRTWSSGHCCRSTKLDRHAASPYHLYPWQLANMWYLLSMPIITLQSYRIVSCHVGELCRLCMVLSDTVSKDWNIELCIYSMFLSDTVSKV